MISCGEGTAIKLQRHRRVAKATIKVSWFWSSTCNGIHVLLRCSLTLVQDLRGQILERSRTLSGSAVRGQRGQAAGNSDRRLSSEGLEGSEDRRKRWSQVEWVKGLEISGG